MGVIDWGTRGTTGRRNAFLMSSSPAAIVRKAGVSWKRYLNRIKRRQPGLGVSNVRGRSSSEGLNRFLPDFTAPAPGKDNQRVAKRGDLKHSIQSEAR